MSTEQQQPVDLSPVKKTARTEFGDDAPSQLPAERTQQSPNYDRRKVSGGRSQPIAGDDGNPFLSPMEGGATTLSFGVVKDPLNTRRHRSREALNNNLLSPTRHLDTGRDSTDVGSLSEDREPGEITDDEDQVVVATDDEVVVIDAVTPTREDDEVVVAMDDEVVVIDVDAMAPTHEHAGTQTTPADTRAGKGKGRAPEDIAPLEPLATAPVVHDTAEVRAEDPADVPPAADAAEAANAGVAIDGEDINMGDAPADPAPVGPHDAMDLDNPELEALRRIYPAEALQAAQDAAALQAAGQLPDPHPFAFDNVQQAEEAGVMEGVVGNAPAPPPVIQPAHPAPAPAPIMGDDDGNAPILPGLPSRNQIANEEPTHRDLNPHRDIPVAVAADPAGPQDLLAVAAPRQPNEGNLRACVVSRDKQLENADPRIRTMIETNPQRYLIMPIFNGGKEIFDKFMQEVLDNIPDALADVAGPNDFTAFSLGQDDPHYGGQGPNTYAPPFCVAIDIHNPAVREPILRIGMAASNTDHAFHITDPVVNIVPWVSGLYRTGGGITPANACKLRGAMASEILTNPAIRLAIAKAWPRSDTRPLNTRILEMVRTIDIRCDPLMDTLTAYMRPATPIPSAWEPVANLITESTFYAGYIKFTPVVYGSDISGPRCMKCKLECHLEQGCPYTTDNVGFWGPQTQISKLTEGKFARRGVVANHNAGHGGGRGGNAPGRGRGMGRGGNNARRGGNNARRAGRRGRGARQ
ncbi:hypothetical protein B0H11DRAFT_2289902 [Mycena galericulata]|nr:hypothetical protein B0H11DRAFT_2289902 [Mycena galericulata]